MHQHVAETSLAIDPNDPSHILAKTRIQRMLLPDENRAAVESLTGCRAGTAWPYKNGILLESNDGGRSFKEVAGGLGGFYEHRATIFWAPNDVIVIAHNGGVNDYSVQARISLDGGKTWVDGTKTGTPLFNKSKEFELAPDPPGHSFMTPTALKRMAQIAKPKKQWPGLKLRVVCTGGESLPGAVLDWAEQDLGIAWSRLPALPHSGMIIRDVRAATTGPRHIL